MTLLIEGIFVFITYIFGVFLLTICFAACIKSKLYKSNSFLILMHLQLLMLFRLLITIFHSLPDYFEGYIFEKVVWSDFNEIAFSFCIQLSYFVVIWNYALLSFHRYLATCRPLLYTKANTRRTVVATILIIWIINTIILIIFKVTRTCCAQVMHYHVFNSAESDNSTITDHEHINVVRYFTISVNIAAILFMFGCFVQINRKINFVHTAFKGNNQVQSNKRSQNSQRRQEIRLTVQTCFILISFIILFIITFSVLGADHSHVLLMAIFLAFWLNCVADSLVLIWFNVELRTVVKKWLIMDWVAHNNTTQIFQLT